MDDCGGAFTMGAIGGGIFQAVKGFRNAPSVSPLMFLCTFNQLLKFDALPLSENDNDTLFRICIKSVGSCCRQILQI